MDGSYWPTARCWPSLLPVDRVDIRHHLVVHAAGDDRPAQLAGGVEIQRLVGQVYQAQPKTKQQQPNGQQASESECIGLTGDKL